MLGPCLSEPLLEVQWGAVRRPIVADAHMKICYKGSEERERRSCCTREMEMKYRLAAERDFHQILQSTNLYLTNLLSSNKAYYHSE